MIKTKKRGAPKKEKPESEKISFRVEPQMKEALNEMAVAEGRSLSNFIKMQLREVING